MCHIWLDDTVAPAFTYVLGVPHNSQPAPARLLCNLRRWSHVFAPVRSKAGHAASVEQGMKEDFIVVHLREPCSFCRKYISGGLRCAASAWLPG